MYLSVPSVSAIENLTFVTFKQCFFFESDVIMSGGRLPETENKRSTKEAKPAG